MPDLAELERRISALEDIEAIKQLKHRYWRHLDLKQWDELAQLFAADATVCYSSGKYEFKGVEAIMSFLSESLGEARGSVTIHHGHHPEIELLGETSARGTWALYNYMFNVKQNRGIRIGAYYEDTLREARRRVEVPAHRLSHALPRGVEARRHPEPAADASIDARKPSRAVCPAPGRAAHGRPLRRNVACSRTPLSPHTRAGQVRTVA